MQLTNESWTAIVTELRPAIYARISRMLRGSKCDAEDLVQETFLEAFEHYPEFRNECKLSTWIAKIAVCRTLNHIRHRSYTSQTFRSAAFDEEVDCRIGLPSQEDDYIHTEDALRVVRRLQDLPVPEKTILRMRTADEMSYKEIAESLGLPMGTVKFRINSARNMIRGDEGGHERGW